jgi:hypothetical protein
MACSKLSMDSKAYDGTVHDVHHFWCAPTVSCIFLCGRVMVFTVAHTHNDCYPHIRMLGIH